MPLRFPGNSFGNHFFAQLGQDDIAFIARQAFTAHLLAGTVVEHERQGLQVLRGLGKAIPRIDFLISEVQHHRALVQRWLG